MKQLLWLALFGFGLLVLNAAPDAVCQEKPREIRVQLGKVPEITVEDVWKGRLRDEGERDRVRGTFCNVCVVALEEGKTYQIDMKGHKRGAYMRMDAYLRLEDENGRHLESDDDSGGVPHARITYMCKVTGKYRIIATTYDGSTGGYLLRVSEAAFLAAPSITRGDASMARAADYKARGKASSAKREYDKAIEDYTKAIGLDRRYVPAYIFRGKARSNKKEFDKAIEDYSKVIQLDPKNVLEFTVTAYIGRGDASMAKAPSSAQKEKDYDKAIEDYTRAIGLDAGNVYEHNAYAYLRRAMARFERKDNEKALADFSEAVRIQEALRKAIELGYHRFRHVENGNDFDSIRNDPRYKDLLKKYAK